jgi:hypothetical protein
MGSLSVTAAKKKTVMTKSVAGAPIDQAIKGVMTNWARRGAAAASKLTRSAERFASKIADTSRCWKCQCKITPGPGPAGLRYPYTPQGSRAYARVAIRCAYCLKTFCRTCSKKHFGPAHIVAVGAELRVKKQMAFALVADGRPVLLALDEQDARRHLSRLTSTPIPRKKRSGRRTP